MKTNTFSLNLSYLELVDQAFFDRILRRSIRCNAETFCRLSQPLLLLLTVGVCCSALKESHTNVILCHTAVFQIMIYIHYT